jgi:hypothetical protein
MRPSTPGRGHRAPPGRATRPEAEPEDAHGASRMRETRTGGSAHPDPLSRPKSPAAATGPRKHRASQTRPHATGIGRRANVHTPNSLALDIHIVVLGALSRPRPARSTGLLVVGAAPAVRRPGPVLTVASPARTPRRPGRARSHRAGRARPLAQPPGTPCAHARRTRERRSRQRKPRTSSISPSFIHVLRRVHPPGPEAAGKPPRQPDAPAASLTPMPVPAREALMLITDSCRTPAAAAITVAGGTAQGRRACP